MKKATRSMLAVAAVALAAGTATAQDRFDTPVRPAPAGPAAPGAPAAPAAAPPKAAAPAAAMAKSADAAERRDFGVAATAQLHPGPLHGPTPNTIPGARLVTTTELAALMKSQPQQVRLFDVLGGTERLPGAFNANAARQGGSFDDSVQREFGAYLQRVTEGRNDLPLVFYCQGLQCWMSYNAALRAKALGYRNVLWYRGGIEAWKAAGLPLAR